MRRSRSRSRSDGPAPRLERSRSGSGFREGWLEDWKVDRQRGSHVILVKDGHIATLSVPDHKELARGTLRSLIRAAGVTAEDFEVFEKS